MTRWFRYYTEALNDPKVQRLSPEMFKHWINLLCMAAMNDGKLPDMEDISFQLRVTPNDALAITEALESLGLIDRLTNQHSVTFTPHNWKKRQYKSDSSAERVAKHRKRKCNVTVTPPEAETETDIKTEPKGSSKKKGFRLPEDWQPTPDLISFAVSEGMDFASAHREADKFRDYFHSSTGSNATKVRWDLAFKNWIRRAAEQRPARKVSNQEKNLTALAEAANELASN